MELNTDLQPHNFWLIDSFQCFYISAQNRGLYYTLFERDPPQKWVAQWGGKTGQGRGLLELPIIHPKSEHI